MKKSITKTNHKKGIILAILSSLCLGLVGTVDKLGTVASKQPFIYSTETIFFAFCFSLAYLFFFNNKLMKNFQKNITLLSWNQIILIGSIASGIVILLRFVGLLQSTGTFASLSQVITTSLTAILANFFLQEKLSKRFWFIFSGIIIATYLVSVGSFSLVTIKQGDAFILAATVFLAIANILTKKVVHKVNPIFVSVGRFFFGFLFLAVISSFFLLQGTPMTFTPFAIFSGLLWTGNVISFNLAMKYIGATLSTVFLMLAPIVTMIIEATILAYHFTPVQYGAAGVVVVSGVFLALKRN